jgi:hypothetical protein
MYAIAIHRKWF